MLDGFVHPDFWPVAMALKRQLKLTDGGAAVCVYHNGHCVADLWGGVKDDKGTPWDKHTMATGFSTTKGVASTALHMCVDRGLLGYEDRVARHWPEFAQNGKEEITIRQVLCHQAGLYDIHGMIDHAGRMLDWEHMVEAIAKARPAHEPGRVSAYHALTYGYIVGEIVRRVSGMHLSKFIQKEIAEPLHLDGLYIGAPAEVLSHAAKLLGVGGIQRSGSSNGNGAAEGKGKTRNMVPRLQRLFDRLGIRINVQNALVALAPKGISSYDFSSPEVLKTANPSANGLFTARSLARMYACIANGGELDGVHLMGKKTLDEVSEIQYRRADQVINIPMNWRLGYHQASTPRGAPRKAFGHFGFGGSGAFADLSRNLSMGFMVNGEIEKPISNLRAPVMAGIALACANRRSGRGNALGGWFDALGIV